MHHLHRTFLYFSYKAFTNSLIFPLFWHQMAISQLCTDGKATLAGEGYRENDLFQCTLYMKTEDYGCLRTKLICPQVFRLQNYLLQLPIRNQNIRCTMLSKVQLFVVRVISLFSFYIYLSDDLVMGGLFLLQVMSFNCHLHLSISPLTQTVSFYIILDLQDIDELLLKLLNA